MDFTPLLKALTEYLPSSQSEIKKSLPFTVLIVSPHPDDECICGGLALRLLKENNAFVINVCVTLGSNIKRLSERSRELEEACEILDFENTFLSDSWTLKVRELKSLIQKYNPDLIIAPHAKDHHPTHIKTSELVKKTLTSLKKTTTLVAWSEYWGQLSKPGLLVEIPFDHLNLQMRALSLHRGEVERNPYHLRLPGWMIDNVRRGAELIGGKGSESPQFAFGVLHQLQIFKNGKPTTVKIPSILDSKSDIAQIFRLILDAAAGSKTRVK